jgi:hypothetical protein
MCCDPPARLAVSGLPAVRTTSHEGWDVFTGIPAYGFVVVAGTRPTDPIVPPGSLMGSKIESSKRPDDCKT